MKKICTGCGQERDAELDFSWKYKDRGIRNTRCRFCQSQVSKQHYKNNKQVYIDKTQKRNKRIREENRTKLFAYLSQHPCVDCGETDAYVLEFDHVQRSAHDAAKNVMPKGISAGKRQKGLI